mmetsp:Transcript_22293/g.33826  ORF Transcript_22293/g.33826 Transcript_22293/m.33826 type:complete len:305 (-) Transcript_22293:12-926(-)
MVITGFILYIVVITCEGSYFHTRTTRTAPLTIMYKANTISTHYHCSPLLRDGEEERPDTALIILNSPIGTPPSPIFVYLWEISDFRVCADGGANRLYDETHVKNQQDEDTYIPDLIRGDLDSLRPAVRDFYGQNGVRIEQDPCQNTNDLDKCLQVISKEWLNRVSSNFQVCIYGAFGGRFDQEMASIQALYKWKSAFQNKLFLYDHNTSAFLLSESVLNEIRLVFYGDKEIPDNEIGDGPTCGLIPIGSRCESVETTGLKWNLEAASLEFGGMVSTSNQAMDPVVTVKSSHPLIFTSAVKCSKN